MLFLIYLIVTLVVLYTEAMNCYRDKAKLDIIHEFIFSALWVVTLPLAIYTVWKLEGKE